MSPVLLLAIVAAASAGLVAAPAAAYTLHQTESGDDVRWRTDVVKVVVDPALADIGRNAIEAVARAFAAWEIAVTEAPGVVLEQGAVDALGYRPGAKNASTIRFAANGDPIAGTALAVTVLTFDADGTVLDADIVINGGGSHPFGVLDEPKGDLELAAKAQDGAARYDLQNVVTHEVGHFLGLGEEPALGEATMFTTSARGELKKRDLSPDDEEGLRALYVPDGSRAGGCSFGARAAGSAWSWWLPALAGVAWAASRRRGRGAIVAGVSGTLWLAAGCGVAPEIGADEQDEFAEVVEARGRLEGGIVVTELTLRARACDEGGCREVEQKVEALGGSAGGITQIVGHHAVPAAGERIPIRLREGRWELPDAFPSFATRPRSALPGGHGDVNERCDGRTTPG